MYDKSYLCKVCNRWNCSLRALQETATAVATEDDDFSVLQGYQQQLAEGEYIKRGTTAYKEWHTVRGLSVCRSTTAAEGKLRTGRRNCD